MDQLTSMRVFMLVAKEKSFHVAAKALGMSPSVISRNVASLEAHLNARLLHRTTRYVSLTPAGERYLEGCRTIMDTVDRVESDVTSDVKDPGGIVKVAAHAAFACRELAELIREFRERHPEVRFEVTAYSGPINVIDGGYDVCFVETEDLQNVTVISRGLTQIATVVVASPAYLKAHGVPHLYRDLQAHHVLFWGAAKERIRHIIGASSRFGDTAGVTFSTETYAAIRDAVCEHLGLAFLPRRYVEKDLADGRLVEVMHEQCERDLGRAICIVYADRYALTTRARHFVEFSLARYRLRPAVPHWGEPAAPFLSIVQCVASHDEANRN